MKKLPEGRRFSSDYQPARKRGPSVTSAIKRRLRAVDEATGRKVSELLAADLVALARAGNGTAIREVMSRIDGPIATVLEGAQTELVTLKVVYSDEAKRREREVEKLECGPVNIPQIGEGGETCEAAPESEN